MRMLRTWFTSLVLGLAFVAPALLAPAAASAKPREARVPLREGRVHFDDLSVALCRELSLPELGLPGDGTIDVSGLKGSVLVAALNESLGEGLRVEMADDALVLHVDVEKLPTDCDAAKRATRVFTAVAAPEATAAQNASYGLKLPDELDPARPLVVMIHGLDCGRHNWAPMAELLGGEGYQVAYFAYPSDQPVADSASMLARHMTELRLKFLNGRVDLLAHSMGGLVARAYVEGPDYRGGVEHLILMAVPNHGSDWAKYRAALEVSEHYGLWKYEPGWSWTWMITDGMGEAGRDLKPGSQFLSELNSLPRRDGVKYTIVAGNRHTGRRVTANCIDGTAGVIRGRVSKWWGFRHARRGLERWAGSVRDKECDSDGPVAVESTRLEGVSDFVLLAADHASLYMPDGTEPPAAWQVIKDRLAR
jgi:pimeloyl-ACP methyl ester carboxylesterase